MVKKTAHPVASKHRAEGPFLSVASVRTSVLRVLAVVCSKRYSLYAVRMCASTQVT